MEVIEAIRSRRSIRSFKPDPVPRMVLEELLETCRWAPSSSNTQPWEFAILGGKVMEEVKTRLREKVKTLAKRNSDIPPADWPEPYRQRETELNHSIDIHQFPPGMENADEKRIEYWRKMGRFHDAPNGIILYTERVLCPRAIFSLGIMTQTICLSALTYGLGTCIMGRAVYWPDMLRELLGIPESKLIAMGIAIGYPDPEALVNSYPRHRVPLDTFTHWHGF